MPYTIRKVRNQNCWRVKNVETGDIKATCTTLEKAKAQVRLLYSLKNKKSSKA